MPSPRRGLSGLTEKSRWPRVGTIALDRRQVSRHLSRRHPYYLTQGEAHALIDAADNKRDRLVMRLLWETGVRVSEAITVNVGDVGRDGIRVLGKGSAKRETAKLQF